MRSNSLSISRGAITRADAPPIFNCTLIMQAAPERRGEEGSAESDRESNSLGTPMPRRRYVTIIEQHLHITLDVHSRSSVQRLAEALPWHATRVDSRCCTCWSTTLVAHIVHYTNGCARQPADRVLQISTFDLSGFVPYKSSSTHGHSAQRIMT